MLNYIWAGLLILSLVFALIYDARDIARDTYRNGTDVPVTLSFPDGYNEAANRLDVEVQMDVQAIQQLYGIEESVASSYAGTLVQNEDGRQLQFAQDIDLPEPMATIRSMTSKRNNDLRGLLAFSGPVIGDIRSATVTFEPVRFVKMAAITQAAIDFADTAVSIALGLIGVIALWMGLLRIAETSGLILSLVRFTQPVFRRLFPEIPKDHPALGMIILNLTANMLGLANAATPLGIKAMESLQELNPHKDTASNSMVMLLAMNTASVQIVPPSLLVAIMGLQVNQLFFSILITTSLSLVIAIVMTKLLEGMKRFRIVENEE
ncbi:MAG: nucleoside recognition domain-containing protein [Rhodothermales bacterium]